MPTAAVMAKTGSGWAQRRRFQPALTDKLRTVHEALTWLDLNRAMKARGTARLGLLLALLLSAGCTSPAPAQPGPTAAATGIQKIKHVVVIMQENRSFDSYFGTFPGADGIPMQNGVPTVCAPDAAGTCIKPYHDSNDKNSGGPHGQVNATADINGGKMDGFVAQAQGSKGCLSAFDPNCSNGKQNDVMGYHDQREIPDYWAYAENYTLQDHMF